MNKVLEIKHCNKSFGENEVLKDISLSVTEGQVVSIIGPSGSGKSTTVRCMNFLEEPTSGHVYIDGQKLTHANKTKIIRESISMVFQQFNLYPHMTVLKNLTIAPMKLHHKSKKEAEQMRSAVKVGDKIITIGGVVGVVCAVKDDKIVIETSADRVRVELQKWAISTNETAMEAQKALEASQPQKKKGLFGRR